MLVQWLVAAATFLSVAAQQGPASLYSRLNGMTFNPPGYTIVMYQSCMQNQNAGNPCGSFSGFQSSNGQYTHMLYGPEAAVSPTCSRTFRLSLACGATVQMSGVNENPTCVYSATLSLPEACGVSMVVGQEAVSVSPTALPPTVTSSTTVSVSSTTTLTATASITASGTTTTTSTATGTPTGSTTLTATPTSTTTLTATPTSSTTLTGTPLFQITAWPTSTTTQTLTATATPLFMITAWPSPSPVNVSATSTPLYYYTAYPSVGSNASGLLSSLGDMASSASPTAMILGSVALGIVGLGAVGGLIAYMRKGGTVGGLLAKVEENKGAITQFANALPISAEQKAKLTGAIADPSSLLPPEAKAKAEELKAKAVSLNQTVLAALPPQLSSVIEAKQAEVLSAVQVAVEEKKEALLAFAPTPDDSATTAAVVEMSPAPAETMQITIAPENLEAFRTFLALKDAANKSIQ
jgi:hypothetical protein